MLRPAPPGMRGAHALDRALLPAAAKPETAPWGVSVLQVARDIDAGPVWATERLVLAKGRGNVMSVLHPGGTTRWRDGSGAAPTKALAQRGVVTDAMLAALDSALDRWIAGEGPLDSANAAARAPMSPRLTLKNRRFSWSQSADKVRQLFGLRLVCC